MTPVTNLGAGFASWSRRTFLGALALAPLVRSARAEGATVEMHQLRFEPAEIAIAAGSTVTFVNRDLVPHTATGATFDTGTLAKDGHKEIQFLAAGEFPYLCKFHRHMTGKVIVR